MPEELPAIPLADILRAANDLIAAGLVEDYALGGALAAIYYVEPFTTYDADIIFVAADKGLTAGIPAIYSHLQEEAVRKAKSIEFDGVPAKVFRPEYIIAIAASVGRHKDLARIEQLMAQAKIDKALLDDLLRRYNFKLPKK